jgi:Zn-finger protein
MAEKPYWEGKRYAFTQNRACEFFPCHQGLADDRFNCLFCYCPLYGLGRDCGGGFRYNEKGYKDCTACLFPHKRENYGKIVEKYAEICKAMRK